jgi:hypothetical protein
MTAHAVFGTSLKTSGAGLVEVDPVQALYAYGSTVRLTAIPTNTTTYFRQWGGPANGQVVNPLDFQITSTQVVAAVFFTLPPNAHSLTVRIEGNGHVTKTPQLSSYTNNAVVSLSATPDAGWFFHNWSGDVNSTLNPLNVLMDTNKIIVAAFTTNLVPPTVTITNPPTDSVYTAPVNIPILALASTGSVALANVATHLLAQTS